MIERQFVKEKMKEFQVQEYISSLVVGSGYSGTTIKRTPMGDKVVIRAAKPGLVVGRKGENIRAMTNSLKKKFNLENPQLEIEEITSPSLDSAVVGERIVKNLERFGTARFKKIAHQALENVMGAGALGIEVLISGKIPGARAKTWRFWQGYMKKSGSVAQRDVDICKTFANLKAGTVGVVVMILRPDTPLPDDVSFVEDSVSFKRKSLEDLKKVGGGRIEEGAKTEGIAVTVPEDLEFTEKPVVISEDISEGEEIIDNSSDKDTQATKSEAGEE